MYYSQKLAIIQVMYRKFEEYLNTWRIDSFRIPLIVRGARQVGKTFIIRQFGENYFSNYIEVNFDADPEYTLAFSTSKPEEIIAKLEVVFNQRIISGETLVFLDEIQECPAALKALRYFKESCPELHIIAAGSLLEFYLQEQQFSFPVGRIEFAYLGPMSFKEFLLALGENILISELQSASLNRPLSDVAHIKALKLLKDYTVIGGMPAAIERYIKTKSYLEAKKDLLILSNGYQHDFLKYKIKNINVNLLKKIFTQAPRLVGQHFKYVSIDKDERSRDIKTVLHQLCWAGVIKQIFATNANGLPLASELKEHKFKILMLDVGLLQNLLSIDVEAILTQELTQINSGILAEQLVGQELLALQLPNEPNIYFWKKESRGATAEVDYLYQYNNKIIPIEVKSGITGRVMSLKKIMAEKQLSNGVVISSRPLKYENNILYLPFYMIDELNNFLVKLP